MWMFFILYIVILYSSTVSYYLCAVRRYMHTCIVCSLGMLHNNFIFYLFLLWPRRCHCTRQPLVYGCSPHSPVLRHACGLLKCHMQFFAVLSYHVDPSFLLSSPLCGSMYVYVAVVCYFGVSFILHPVQMSNVSQPPVPFSVYCYSV